MKALELAKAVEHWVSCDAGIRGEECRAAAAELRRLAEVNAELLEVLEGVLKIGRGTSGRIIIEVWQEDVIKAQIAKAKEQQ